MPPPFERVTLAEFSDLLHRFVAEPGSRRIDMVHMHHTWRPSRTQYKGHDTIEAMWRYHTQHNHWSDIAQHITIGPDGAIWLGRNWNAPPASASGFNGNRAAGPFMFETIGDFDLGKDPFDGVQRETVVEVIARVQLQVGLPPEALRFHNQMSSKSCPGSSISFDEIVNEVRTARQRLGTPATSRDAAAVAPFGDDAYRIEEIWRAFRAKPEARDPADAELADAHGLAPDGPSILGEGGPRGTGRALDDAAISRLRPHFINLRQGLFSDDGRVTSSASDVDAIFQDHLPRALKAAQARQEPLRVVVFAHGGLVSESSALAIANTQAEWWLANNVYPIFFIWETGLGETIGQLLSHSRQVVSARAARDLADYITDPVLEAMARVLQGPRIWASMKDSARRASESEGGAHYAAQRLAEFCRGNKEAVELHAVGHSAGAIFHSHFVPVCLESGVPSLRTVSLLAPAMRVDRFKSSLVPLLGNGIDHLSMFTMRKDLELADNCARAYRKSLLYLIHYALEPEERAPVLGLEVSVRADAALRGVFGLAGTRSPAADVVWSTTLRTDGDGASTSTTHGGFDNDGPTMNSVLRRILGRPSGHIHEFPADRARALLWDQEPLDLPDHVLALVNAPVPPLPAPPPQPGQSASASVFASAYTGSRRALCVGIDTYPSQPLYGCVADAKLWARTLQGLGFAVPDLLLDHDATHARILAELKRLVNTSRQGDVLVFQYSGHGTQVPDTSGDEAHGDSPGYDEALCPVDFDSGAFVVDDDIGAIFDGLPAGVSLTCFIDCCHSGTITRFAVGRGLAGMTNGSRARFLPATPQMINAHLAYRASLPKAAAPSGVRGRDTMREILFAACLSAEVAYESAGQGDFTLRATNILSNGAAGLTNDRFRQAVTEAFGPMPRQHPGLYCIEAARTRPLLG